MLKGTEKRLCPNALVAAVDEKTVDVLCEVDASVEQLKFMGPGVKQLCEVQLSGAAATEELSAVIVVVVVVEVVVVAIADILPFFLRGQLCSTQL
ncbi:hypothetical protein ElyMa_001495500 [Elysia marginata]|uniref:Uncharacterized protein n=1 Tax=Elysia marginata TaxID=1093978 RepID=A0AAV4J677_9GAST|nr:hypothetical protein ElyMa_001495500 [Elysia marginata]